MLKMRRDLGVACWGKWSGRKDLGCAYVVAVPMSGNLIMNPIERIARRKGSSKGRKGSSKGSSKGRDQFLSRAILRGNWR
jgi:hypothetical protein